MSTNIITEKELHATFEVGILLKGVHSIFEILGGILVLFTSKATILSLVAALTQDELGEDSRDFLANYLVKMADSLSISGQHFVSLYLLSHGIIKLFVVAGLLKKKMWAYPTSIIVFSLFIVYQLYRYSFTHSPWLLLFTVFDVIVIFLTLHEYRSIKRLHQKN